MGARQQTAQDGRTGTVFRPSLPCLLIRLARSRSGEKEERRDINRDLNYNFPISRAVSLGEAAPGHNGSHHLATLTGRRLGQDGRDELLGELERVAAHDGGHADALHIEAHDLGEVLVAWLQPAHAEPEIGRIQ